MTDRRTAELEYAPLLVAVQAIAAERHERQCWTVGCGKWPDHHEAARAQLGIESDSVDDWPLVAGDNGLECGRCGGMVGLGPTTLSDLVNKLCLHLAYDCTDERLAKALAHRRPSR